MKELITALVVMPGHDPWTIIITNELQRFQQIVGGYIEAVGLYNRVVLICNEEGKLQGLEPNFRLGNDVIVGPALIVGSDGEDFTDLEEEEIELAKELIKEGRA